MFAALPALVEASRAEPGCLGYEAQLCSVRGGAILLLERYVDHAAFEAHRSSLHFQQIVLGDIVPHLQTRDLTVCVAT